MIELLVTLTPILLIDAFAPGLLALVVFAAATDKPIANSVALLAGHGVAYFLGGIVLAQGVDRAVAAISYQFSHPENIDFVIEAVVGVGCLIWSLRPKKGRSDGPKMPEWELTPLKCFAFGAVTRSVGMPFELPYFAAISQILKADLSVVESLAVLGVYNLATILPYFSVPVMMAKMGQRARPVLERVTRRVLDFGRRSVPWLVFLLGVVLIFDAVYYWVVGTPII